MPHILSDLGAALALLFVLEGIFPFLSPAGTKRALARILSFGDREIRIAGLGSMLVGVVLLFLIN
ncbi:MAG TPA: DUF2065 domain-containing protein [Steroidobacteraceae bacterium]|nr:DUF2065 domain-containing protein [Steroidobacteraceae bacterium]